MCFHQAWYLQFAHFHPQFRLGKNGLQSSPFIVISLSFCPILSLVDALPYISSRHHPLNGRGFPIGGNLSSFHLNHILLEITCRVITHVSMQTSVLKIVITFYTILRIVISAPTPDDYPDPQCKGQEPRCDPNQYHIYCKCVPELSPPCFYNCISLNIHR